MFFTALSFHYYNFHNVSSQYYTLSTLFNAFPPNAPQFFANSSHHTICKTKNKLHILLLVFFSSQLAHELFRQQVLLSGDLQQSPSVARDL